MNIIDIIDIIDINIITKMDTVYSSLFKSIESFIKSPSTIPVRLSGGVGIRLIGSLFGVGIGMANYLNIKNNKYYQRYPNDNLLHASLVGMSIFKGSIYAVYAPYSVLFLSYDIMFRDIKSFNRHFIPCSVHDSFIRKSFDVENNKSASES
jgi:hypothetical protein